MAYPKETLTKKGEVRVLEEMGEYIKYTYVDSETGKLVKKGKYSLILKSGSSKRHVFVVPLKNGKSMVVKDQDEKRDIAVLDKGKKLVF